jgi:hypothetical protein
VFVIRTDQALFSSCHGSVIHPTFFQMTSGAASRIVTRPKREAATHLHLIPKLRISGYISFHVLMHCHTASIYFCNIVISCSLHLRERKGKKRREQHLQACQNIGVHSNQQILVKWLNRETLHWTTSFKSSEMLAVIYESNQLADAQSRSATGSSRCVGHRCQQRQVTSCRYLSSSVSLTF